MWSNDNNATSLKLPSKHTIGVADYGIKKG